MGKRDLQERIMGGRVSDHQGQERIGGLRKGKVVNRAVSFIFPYRLCALPTLPGPPAALSWVSRPF